jgi:hypothetical protein
MCAPQALIPSKKTWSWRKAINRKLNLVRFATNSRTNPRFSCGEDLRCCHDPSQTPSPIYSHPHRSPSNVYPSPPWTWASPTTAPNHHLPNPIVCSRTVTKVQGPHFAIHRHQRPTVDCTHLEPSFREARRRYQNEPSPFQETRPPRWVRRKDLSILPCPHHFSCTGTPRPSCSGKAHGTHRGVGSCRHRLMEAPLHCLFLDQWHRLKGSIPLQPIQSGSLTLKPPTVI